MTDQEREKKERHTIYAAALCNISYCISLLSLNILVRRPVVLRYLLVVCPVSPGRRLYHTVLKCLHTLLRVLLQGFRIEIEEVPHKTYYLLIEQSYEQYQEEIKPDEQQPEQEVVLKQPAERREPYWYHLERIIAGLFPV